MRTKRTTAPSTTDRLIEAVLEDSGNSRRGGRPRRYRPAEVASVLRQEGGVFTAAARRLGCDHETIASYARKYPTVRKAREEGLECLRSMAENVILERLRAGDPKIACWVLRSQLGGSEWREQPKAIEVAGAEGASAQPVVVLPQVFGSLEEWAKAARPVE